MIIKKFQGNTETEAITKARDELGKDAVVMNVKTIKPRGIMKLFKPQVVEVTAALDESNNTGSTAAASAPQPSVPSDAAREAAEAFKSMMAAVPKPESDSAGVQDPKAAPVYSPGLPPSPASAPQPSPEADPAKSKALEENMEKLQELLRAQIASEEMKGTKMAPAATDRDPATRRKEEAESSLSFIKMIYNTLVENEVDEHYVNQIMGEMDNVIHGEAQIDSVLSNLYQKLILKFGRTEGIALDETRPTVAFFIGPTGVGKTTTVAKLASIFKIGKKKQVAFLTADTYRISATEQLKTYADIIQAPISVVYTPEDVESELSKYKNYDLILVDTAGYSHKNSDQQQEIKRFIDAVGEDYNKQVYLVLSATTKYADLKSIVDAYKSVSAFRLIFTKLDETGYYGNLLNMKMYSGAPLSYTTNGQNVPDDLQVFNSQRIVKLLLGGNA
ncbi:MAG: flagellar biosynthesis protein FlhF [Lachnospiraceae bacterium]|nr:flagellar biosynthesis protein FlhF [Lachnospiraceae bacterium]